MGHGAADRWAVRTAGDPARYAGQVRAEISGIGRQLLVTGLQPMQTYVERAQDGTRFSLLLIGVFAVMAALLSGVGLYGVLSTVVRQHTAEIGVRMALGAAPGAIFQLVVGQGLRLSAGRHPARSGGGLRSYASDDQYAGGRPGDRSTHFRRRGRSLSGDRRAGVLDSRTPRGEAGPDPGAARRVGVMTSPSCDTLSSRRALARDENSTTWLGRAASFRPGIGLDGNVRLVRARR